uniref:Elongation factor Ts, mitochondrial n=1 Tax=Crouania attenuata TaxID=42002 RepID=A0A4D6WPZ5_9FLOR|nr:Translation elongation factor Ts [Crouania attenuata]
MSQEILIDKTKIKELRRQTGAGFNACKKALNASNGDLEIAMEDLKKKGLAIANKKSERIASEGIIECYIHNGSKLGILMELNCETDFVAKQDKFHNLAKNICMQIAACPSTEYVSINDIPANVIEYEKNIEASKDDLNDKPDKIKEQILAGRLEKRLKELSLMNQLFIKDMSISVEDLVKQHIVILGENIKIRRFTRFILGEGLEKKHTNLADEVTQMIG